MSARAGRMLLAAAATCALVAALAPWLGFRDPNAQPDGLVLRDLGPWSRVEAVALADGTLRFADEIRETPATVEIRRGARWESFARSALARPAPDGWRRSELFVLGTDGYGRDLLARLVFGARVSLSVGLLAAAIAVALGALVGVTAGLFGGFVDALLMRFTDLVLSVPRLFLAALLVALYGRSLAATVWILALTSWMAAARLVRGQILALRERPFVQAARAAGAPRWRLAWSHLLPAATPPLLVEGVLRVGDTILIEASLSFLGLSVPPPNPTWGNMIAEGRDRLLDAWWIATLPGLAIVVTVVVLHLFGESARRRLTPAA